MKGISSDLIQPNLSENSSLRIAIVHTQWNAAIITALVEGAKSELQRLGVYNIHIEQVPGAYELPLGAHCALTSYSYPEPVVAVICIGCLIKGETMHFEYICEAVTQGIMRLNLDHKKPVIFGVLAVMNESQAQARAGIGEGSHNHGVEWAQSAVKMALLKKKSSPPKVY
jgi:6,7-dimethyl-8-ribityllumazine synthase